MRGGAPLCVHINSHFSISAAIPGDGEFDLHVDGFQLAGSAPVMDLPYVVSVGSGSR